MVYLGEVTCLKHTRTSLQILLSNRHSTGTGHMIFFHASLFTIPTLHTGRKLSHLPGDLVEVQPQFIGAIWNYSSRSALPPPHPQHILLLASSKCSLTSTNRVRTHRFLRRPSLKTFEAVKWLKGTRPRSDKNSCSSPVAGPSAFRSSFSFGLSPRTKTLRVAKQLHVNRTTRLRLICMSQKPEFLFSHRGVNEAIGMSRLKPHILNFLQFLQIHLQFLLTHQINLSPLFSFLAWPGVSPRKIPAPQE